METTNSTQDLQRKVKNPGCKLAHVRVQRPISAGNFKWFGYYQLDYIVALSPNVNLPLVLVFCIQTNHSSSLPLRKQSKFFSFCVFQGSKGKTRLTERKELYFFFFFWGGGREGDCRFKLYGNQDKLRLCRPLGSSTDWPLKNVITTLTYLQGVNFGPRVEGQGLLRMYSSWTTVVFRVSNKVCNFLLFNLLERVSVRSRSREQGV